MKTILILLATWLPSPDVEAPKIQQPQKKAAAAPGTPNFWRVRVKGDPTPIGRGAELLVINANTPTAGYEIVGRDGKVIREASGTKAGLKALMAWWDREWKAHDRGDRSRKRDKRKSGRRKAKNRPK